MKDSKKSFVSSERHNPVAKNMEKFNRPATYKDRKKEMKRGGRKHKRPYSFVSSICFTSHKVRM